MSASLTKQIADLKKNKKRKNVCSYLQSQSQKYICLSPLHLRFDRRLSTVCASVYLPLYSPVNLPAFFSHIQFSAAQFKRTPKRSVTKEMGFDCKARSNHRSWRQLYYLQHHKAQLNNAAGSSLMGLYLTEVFFFYNSLISTRVQTRGLLELSTTQLFKA